MRKTSKWLVSVTAMSLCGCNGAKLPGSTTGTTSTSGSFDTGLLDSVLNPQLMATVQSAIGSFQTANSSSNFTMPIGNNFTMPIGNNFTMPIGNNFTMPIGTEGSGYRVQSASENLAKSIRFGFMPIPGGATVSTTTTNVLPDQGTDATQSATVLAKDSSGNTTMAGTLGLSWWNDAQNPDAAASYADTLNYTTLVVPGHAHPLTGDFTVKESATSTFTATPDAGGTLMLSVNAMPANPATAGQATIDRYLQQANLTDGSGGSVNLTIDQSAFTSFQVPLTKALVQVPTSASVSGSLVSDNNTSLGIALNASASFAAYAFYINGTLTPSGGTPILESYTLDLKGGTSTLTYTSPATATSDGWQMTMHFDYGAALLHGVGGTSALTGEMWLIDQNGNQVSGGKLADILADASGNPLIKWVDGSAPTTWAMPQAPQ